MSEADRDKRRPVTVLTGFLGSGKTTTLARLLKTRAFAGALVVMNEFADIALDHLLIETSEERYALLDNGCVCCTVRDDLIETLLTFAARAEAPDGLQFNRVVIETTGLADPAPILHSLMADERLAAAYRIDGVLTMIDAVNGIATLGAHPQAIKQAAVADRLLIAKTDLADEGALSDLLARLRTLNPMAEVVVSRHGDAPAEALVGLGLDTKTSAKVVGWFERATVASRFRAEAHEGNCDDPHCSHPRHKLSHGEDVSTFSLVIDAPLRWAAFKQWLEYLALLKGEDLLRFKGLIHIAEKPETPVVVHGVQHVFHPPRELDGWPSADRRTRLVFITRGIRQATIESTLSKFAAVEPAAMRRSAA